MFLITGISEVQLIVKTLMNNSPVEPHHYKVNEVMYDLISCVML